MTKKTNPRRAKAARERIAKMRASVAEMDLLCSGTLLERMMKCGKPNCPCATDPAARHGPYYQWGRMRGGKLVHRLVTAQQAQELRQAITNYHKLRKLLLSWELESEALIDTSEPN